MGRMMRQPARSILPFAIAAVMLMASTGYAADGGSAELINGAWGLLNQGKFDDALKLFTKAIAADDADPRAHRGAGFVLHFKLKRHAASLPHYLKALELDPGNAEFMAEAALAYGDLKDYDRACPLLTRSFERYREKGADPPDWIPLTIASYHLFHLEKKDYRAGIPYLLPLIQGTAAGRDSGDSALDWLAYAHYQLKEYDRFLEYATRYVQRGKNEQVVKNHLERLAVHYYRSGDPVEAKRYADRRGMDWWLTRILASRKIVIRGNVRLRMLRDAYFRNIVPGTVYIPLPETNDYQQFVSLESTPAHSSIISRGPCNIAAYDFSRGFPERLSMTITVKNRLYRHRPAGLKSYTEAGSEAGHYALYRDSYYDIDSPELVRQANLIAGGAATPLEKARLIHVWVDENITHILEMERFRKKRPDGSLEYNEANITKFSRVSEILAARIGHCGQISALYCGMLRTQGIPVRVIDGLTIDPGGSLMKGNCGEHYVTEIYDDTAGKWFYVEPQFRNHFGVNQFWHVVFGYEVLKKEYPNMFDPLSVRWMEHYRHGNPAAFTYEASIEEW